MRLPKEWLSASRPMLWQYLHYNDDLWNLRAYGVSAQGGALPRDRARLQAIERASERISVVGHGGAAHDPTAPIAWLMSGT